MPVLKVKTIGSGQPGDPIRVNLPTYQEILTHYEQGWALVSVPDEVIGLHTQDTPPEGVERTSQGHFYPSLSEGQLAKIHDHLDNRYKEHAGKFRVELAE